MGDENSIKKNVPSDLHDNNMENNDTWSKLDSAENNGEAKQTK